MQLRVRSEAVRLREHVVLDALLFTIKQKVTVPCCPNVIEERDEKGFVELKNPWALAHDLPDAINPQGEDGRALVLPRQRREIFWTIRVVFSIQGDPVRASFAEFVAKHAPLLRDERAEAGNRAVKWIK